MSEQRICITTVNHVAMEIAAPPDAVWRAILDEYVEARKFRELGTVEPIDDPAAIFGGYRTRIEQGSVIDERIVHITERDETTRRLSAYAEYLSVPGGLYVHATYHAEPCDGGTRYAADCYSRVSIDAPENGSRADVAKAVADMEAAADVHLLHYLESVKARLEGVG